MNNIWTVILLVIVCVVLGNYLSQYIQPLGWISFIVAIAIVGVYLFKRNQRIQ